MPAFSFVHVADIHLDSPFVGLEHLEEAHPHVVETLREATFKAFDTVIRLCIDREVDFLLIAGDVYDAADRSLRAQIRFRDGLAQLSEAGIHSFVVHGNHDPLDGWTTALRMPERAHVFGKDLQSVSFVKEGEAVACIHGLSYPKRDIGRTFGRGFQRKGSEQFQIGLFHCNVGGHPGHDPYAPRTREELVESGLDYWALGHIHEKLILSPEHPFIGYPGSTQGRQINEDGPRGCFLVRVSAKGEMESKPDFIPTDAVRWIKKDLDISGLDLMDDLLVSLEYKLNEIQIEAGQHPAVTRVTLTGRGQLHHSLMRPQDAQYLLSRLRQIGREQDPFVWVEKLDLHTHPEVDIDLRRQTPDFLGDLLRLIKELRASPKQLSQLQGHLQELYGHGRAGRLLEQLEVEDMSRLLDEVETRCVDQLLGEEE